MEGHDAKEGGVYKKKWLLEKGDRDTSIKKKKEIRTLREESKHCNILYNISLLG